MTKYLDIDDVVSGNPLAQSQLDNLRQAIREAGEMFDWCTYNVLGKACSNCRCKRRTNSSDVGKEGSGL